MCLSRLAARELDLRYVCQKARYVTWKSSKVETFPQQICAQQQLSSPPLECFKQGSRIHTRAALAFT